MNINMSFNFYGTINTKYNCSMSMRGTDNFYGGALAQNVFSSKLYTGKCVMMDICETDKDGDVIMTDVIQFYDEDGDVIMVDVHGVLHRYGMFT